MNISLRAEEKLYLNGAVIKVDRKVNIELLNDATFLLQSHVLQADEAITPLRQIYFATQIMLMDPSARETATNLSKDLIASAKRAFGSDEIVKGLESVEELLKKSRPLDAMKTLRHLYPLEREIMFPENEIAVKQVA